MKSLTIIYTSNRDEPEFQWFLDSYNKQADPMTVATINFVDAIVRPKRDDVCHFMPKPTPWQGRHRLTGEDFWAMSSARNSGLCVAQTQWVWFLDDRSVLMPGCIDAIKDAMAGNYAVFGSYEKRINMKVEGGEIIDAGEVTGLDNRKQHVEKYGLPNPTQCGGEWGYGCSVALPLEWALNVGGFEEGCDSLGMEDCIFGLMLQNNGHTLKYDTRLMMIEDRTPGKCGPTMRREDQGVSPWDASHRALELFGTARNTSNRHLLLQSRQAVLQGKLWPVLLGPREHWWDAAPINQTYMQKP